jgi:2,3-dihydroxybenzoate-AMP ligase/mycobactin salicyl-AMP ligase
MTLEGFTPYDSKAAALYAQRRWWLGLTLGEMFDKICDLYPSKKALVGSGRRYTYSELRVAVDTMAFRLLQEGYQPGDRILLQLPNWPEFVISYFALQKAGLIMVLLTVNHTAAEISHLADLTQPRGWILPARYRETDMVPLVKNIMAQNPDLDLVTLAKYDLSSLRKIYVGAANSPPELVRRRKDMRLYKTVSRCQHIP